MNNQILKASLIAKLFNFKLLDEYEGIKPFWHVWHSNRLIYGLSYEDYIERIKEIYDNKPVYEFVERYRIFKPVESEELNSDDFNNLLRILYRLGYGIGGTKLPEDMEDSHYHISHELYELGITYEDLKELENEYFSIITEIHDIEVPNVLHHYIEGEYSSYYEVLFPMKQGLIDWNNLISTTENQEIREEIED